MCGVDGDRRVFEEKAAFAMVMEARKRVKARKRFITILPGVMTHVKGRSVSGNVPTLLPKTFPRDQSPPARVHAEECGRRTCACATSDWRTVINGTACINWNELIFNTEIR